MKLKELILREAFGKKKKKMELNPFSENLYGRLGVNKNSNNLQIKKAYKKCVIKFHPDKMENFDDTKFKLISEAYKILMNKELRKNYDETGLKCIKTEKNYSDYVEMWNTCSYF